MAGGLALVAAAGYPVVEVVVAGAWPEPGYDWSANYVSDLGVTQCVVTDRVICSPRFALMNAAFVAQGVLTAMAAVLLAGLVRCPWRRWVVGAMVVHAVGSAGLGVFPGSIVEALDGDRVRMVLHTVASVLAVGGGVAAIVLAAGATLSRPRGRRVYGVKGGYGAVCAALGAVALAGVVVDIGGFDVGLGPGGVQRLTVYPIVAWLVVTGGAVLGTVGGPGRRGCRPDP